MQRYDFTIDGEPVGSFELTQELGWLRSKASFTVAGTLIENSFAVRLEAGLPVEARGPSGVWHPVARGVYPTSAWPIVLRAGLEEYPALDEGGGEVAWPSRGS